jgi:hypothetical protein
MPQPPDDTPDIWRQAILADEGTAQQQLAALDTRDHHSCMQLCHALLSDPAPEVQRAALLVLAQRGDHDDPLAEAGALALLEQPELQDDALAALERIATPAALPKLFFYAEQGAAAALTALHAQVRSDEDRARLLRVARQQLFSQHSPTREVALRILRALSSLTEEEDLLLRATRRYYDEFVIQALGETSGKVLPALQELLPRFSTTSTEHRALSLAIRRLHLSIQRRRSPQ